MAKNLRLTGLASFSHPKLYGKSPRINQVVKVSDGDATILKAINTKNAAGTTIPVFTEVASNIVPHLDVSTYGPLDGVRSTVAIDGQRKKLHIPGTNTEVDDLVGAAASTLPATGWTYDSMGRIATYSENGITYTVGYDSNGRTSTITGGGKVRTLQYNNMGQLTGEVVS